MKWLPGNKIAKILILAIPFLAGAAADPFLIRPYVYSVGKDKISLAWRYRDANTRGESLNLSADGLHFSEIPAKLKENIYTADLPVATCGYGKKVSYRVPGMSEEAQLDEIPCPHDNQSARFTLIADTQLHATFTKETVTAVEKLPASALLIAGDLVQVGEKEQEWLDLFHALQPLVGHRLLIPVIGNHEYWQDDTAKSWEKYFQTPPKDMHFVFDIGQARILAINSNLETHPELIGPQVKWLNEQLAKTPPDRWTFVVMHHPPYSSANVLKLNPKTTPREEIEVEREDGNQGPDSVNPKGIHKILGSIRGREHLALQKFFVPIFEKYNVNFVLAGHRHIYEHSLKHGIHYISAGPAGGTIAVPLLRNPYAVISPSRERTITNFTVDTNSVRVQTLKIDGQPLEDFTVRR